MQAAAGNPGWSCRPVADMAPNARSQYGRIAALTVAIVLSAQTPAMAQTGDAAQPLPRTAPRTAPQTAPRTVEETAADLQLVFDRHVAESRCEDPDSVWMRHFAPVIAQLSKTAILYAIPCTAGAYNIAYRLYMRETGEIGGVETLYFATWSGDYGWGGTDLLFNINVDGPRLSALYKGRGLGDCGTNAQWVWRDYAFRLVRYAAQDPCEGIPTENWPVIFEYSRDGNEPDGNQTGSAQ
ncbi:MAG: DUF1176 domain-containing protein [Alphaproteobacteria bacterium]|nr:MAG: DUF1176 domain-containing protein [Alphaproteobacteria bacterium]